MLLNGIELWDTLLDLVPGGEGIIAGGAIRDFFLGKPPKDIDVFYEYNDEDIVQKGSKGDYFNGSTLGWRYMESNDFMADYRGIDTGVIYQEVWKATFTDIPINIIGLKMGRTPLEHMYDFDLGTSKALYDGNLFYTHDFIQDMKNKTCTLYNPTVSLEHSKKRAERFIKKNEDFTFVDKSGENAPAVP